MARALSVFGEFTSAKSRSSASPCTVARFATEIRERDEWRREAGDLRACRETRNHGRVVVASCRAFCPGVKICSCLSVLI